MTTLDVLIRETRDLGYREDAIRLDYAYSDVWAGEGATSRCVPLAAFTQTPASYRTAAFGALQLDERNPEELVREHRALGAPMLFVIDEHGVSLWQVFAQGPPRLLERTGLEALPNLFAANRKVWAPDAIHRAKSIGRLEPAYQLDFVDIGLIPAIEGEIHTKLDRLLQEALATTRAARTDDDVRSLFKGLFRLLAAKILIDRRNPLAVPWDTENVDSVLSGIGQYYNLGPDVLTHVARSSLAEAWSVLRNGLNVANISADDLAYVYENTLVTPQARRDFGTHSTPRYLAEYIVSRLRLWQFGERPPQIFEPFAGAGVFLVSALRHMRDALPHAWNDQKRHDLLVSRIRGAEIDPFACEVATLSLILADYPNANGWKIEEADLFHDGKLATRMRGAEVILCNPPFETFGPGERLAYPAASAEGGSKAAFALQTALDAHPVALGFVVPRSILISNAYADQRRQIERCYREIELVSLPDDLFSASRTDAALLIARELTDRPSRRVIYASEVDEKDRREFAATGLPSRTREMVRPASAPPDGILWVTPLEPLWDYLATAPRLGDSVSAHWGLRWRGGNQAERARLAPARGWSAGLLNTYEQHQFELGEPIWLDTRPDEIYGAGDLAWSSPKILCNAGRASRFYWRLAAAVDRTGLFASQQFIGIWPRHDVDLDAFAAILNGPVVNAFMTEHSFDKRFRIRTLLDAPVPRDIPERLGSLAREYVKSLEIGALWGDAQLSAILNEMDELMLSLYDLPPRLERALLAAFGTSPRPLAHSWTPWHVDESGPALTLRERRSGLMRASGAWPKDHLKPLPMGEGSRLVPFLP